VKTRIRRAALAVSAIALSASTLAATGVVGDAPASAQTSSSAKVDVGDNFFKPEDLEIVAGTKVTWTNTGKILHNVTPNKGKKFGTKSLPKGKSYSYRFKKAGKFAYYCTFHGSPGSGQHGTIIVKPAPTPTTTTTGVLDQKSG
jgi:plastocyanin